MTDDPQDTLLRACRRIAEAMDLFDEAAAQELSLGRRDLRALNLLEDGALPHVTVGRTSG